MTLNSHSALNIVFRVESFSVDVLVLRHDCFKLDGVAYNCQPQVVSSDIRLMPIFVGVRC